MRNKLFDCQFRIISIGFSHFTFISLIVFEIFARSFNSGLLLFFCIGEYLSVACVCVCVSRKKLSSSIGITHTAINKFIDCFFFF